MNTSERARCGECGGRGSFRKFAGPDEYQEPCQACLGYGVELTRNELANLDYAGCNEVDADTIDDDLRLVPDPVEQADGRAA